MSDLRQLLQRCLAGEEEGAREFVARFQQPVFGLCYRMLGHFQDAEDVTQDALLRALRHLSRWDQSRPFRPWLMAIAANRCRTALDRRRRRPHPTAETVDTAVAPPEPTSDLGEELQLALESVRDELRCCFVLFYQDGMSCAEISEAMNVPEGTVKTWLHRTRRQLAERLRQRGIVPETTHELPGLSSTR